MSSTWLSCVLAAVQNSLGSGLKFGAFLSTLGGCPAWSSASNVTKPGLGVLQEGISHPAGPTSHSWPLLDHTEDLLPSQSPAAIREQILFVADP